MKNNIYFENPDNSAYPSTKIENFWKHFDADATVTYSLYLPIDGNSSGVLYAPRGVFQIIDYIAAYDGKILSGEYLNGRVLDADATRALTTEEEKFVRIFLNFDGRHSDLLVENDKWLYSSIAEGKNFYVFFRAITNISTGQISNLIFYYNTRKDKIKYSAITEDNYHLLKDVLLYEVYKDYE